LRARKFATAGTHPLGPQGDGSVQDFVEELLRFLNPGMSSGPHVPSPRRWYPDSYPCSMSSSGINESDGIMPPHPSPTRSSSWWSGKDIRSLEFFSASGHTSMSRTLSSSPRFANNWVGRSGPVGLEIKSPSLRGTACPAILAVPVPFNTRYNSSFAV